MNSSKATDVLTIIGKHSIPPLAAADVDRDRLLSELGIDSLKFMMLVIEIEDCVGRPLFQVDEVGAVSRVAHILEQLEQEAERESERESERGSERESACEP